jgi:hypothetical protein
MSGIDYYNKHFGIKHCLNCDNIPTFRGVTIGYLTYCCIECRDSHNKASGKLKGVNSGKKQSTETIQKRIANTDQSRKENTKQNTMLARYGKKFHCFNPESRSKRVSDSLSGKSHTKEHHIKVIESKRKNNTLFHSESTKQKIKNSINILYQSDDPPMTLSKFGAGNKHHHGYYNNFYFRSSWELFFIKYCQDNGIEIISAESKEYRVRYVDNEKQRYYYPDYYLPRYDMIVEIKPKSRLDDSIIKLKADAAKCVYKNYKIITEDELANLDDFFRTGD